MLAGFVAKFRPEIAAMARDVRAKLQTLFPGAYEMAYDNYDALVIGFGPTPRPSEALFSIVVRRDHISVCFLAGVFLDDPGGVLRGEGNLVRHIRLENAKTLDGRAIRALLRQAVRRSPKAFDSTRARSLEIRAENAKQRPRR